MTSDASTPSLEGASQVIAGRYEVIGLLGVGAMGAVYKVRDRELDEVVALKMLKREIAGSPGMIERFRREVKLARRVTHPNVARTFDLGEHQGDRFLTMELIEGESLKSILDRERQLALSRVVDISSAICAGLEAAHEAGVVHRDLKPDNVMIASAGRVVITDFGIARAQESGAALRTAVPVGTPAYMSPEQVEARPDIDARADLYALGAMIFELLTGHLPFEADSVFAIAAMRLTQPPPDPRARRPDLPEAVAQIVMRCMARKPEDRPPTARDVAARLATLTMPTHEAATRGARPAHASVESGAKTVAVLPFRNASGVREDDYLVDGLTDDLIDGLSMAPGLRVRPRGLVMQHKASESDPRELARQLDVQAVVEGSVRAAAETLRVSARVLSVEDGFQIWAKRFDGTRADVLKIGDEVAHAVAEALAVRKPVRAAMVADPVAIDLYLKGRHEYLKFWAPANARAVDLLAQAHQRAPDDALIMSAYAASLARHVAFNDPEQTAGSAQLARQMAERAVEVAPRLAEAHVALATVRVHASDPVGAASGVTRALAISPLSTDAHELRARLLNEVGDPREALAAAEQAMKLDARLLYLRFGVVGRAYTLLEDWDEVARLYSTPPEDEDQASLFWLQRVRMACWRRDEQSVRETLERVAAAKPFASLPMVQTLCRWLLQGKIGGAVPFGQQAAAGGRDRAFFYQLRAEIEAYIGNTDAVLTSTEGAVARGLYDLSWMDRCPLLESIRATPRFQELRAPVARVATRTLLELRGSDATLAS